ncbi:MAG: EAL domain-containing response regulator [Burkholderiales bacterium]
MSIGPASSILLLDDDPFMLQLLGMLLAQRGHPAVTPCDNARAALACLDTAAVPPGLILCDLNMPEMDGVEFVRELVKRRYRGSLVLISGEDERVLQSAERLVRAHRLTVLGHLHKPFTSDALDALLVQWVGNQPGPGRADMQPYPADAVRAAIAQGELINHYQPKVAVATGEVVGVETLVRWQHPADGLVYPDSFIGVAERHGLINDLTRVVMRAALAQAGQWREAGLPLRLAINLSMDNLAQLDFPDYALALVTTAGIEPQQVVFEVTESRLMQDLRGPLDVLTRLRMKRFRLSIDDFGTGHSSLSQLRDIPFDELKIDQGFVHGASGDDTVRAIYDASQQLGQQLHLDIVAEGVEDRADWDFVRRAGCGLAQGYFIARPMPAAQLPGWISAWQSRLHTEGLTIH